MNETSGRPRLGAAEARRIRVNLVRVAGLAALLGLLMEAVVVLGGEATASLSSLLDHGLWPYLVCMAVAIGRGSGHNIRPSHSPVPDSILTPQLDRRRASLPHRLRPGGIRLRNPDTVAAE